MSSNNSHISDIAKRILSLRDEFSTDKEFLKKCDIENHSFVTTLRKGSNKNPGSDYLEKIVRGTGCSGTWLLTGEGQKYGVRENISLAAEGEHGNHDMADQDEVPYGLLNQAFALLNRIEQKAAGSSTDPLPGDVELVLSRLLNTSLERRHKDLNSDDQN